LSETHQVTCTRHEPREAAVAKAFIFCEFEAPGGVRHAYLVPRDWNVLTEVPVDPDPTAPRLDSVVLEDPTRGDGSAVFVSGWVGQDFAAGPREVATALAERDGYGIYRWNDEDDEAGGARAMASDKHTLCAIRVLPHGDRWAFFSAVGPKDRLGDFGGAVQNALVSWRLFPEWAEDVS